MHELDITGTVLFRDCVSLDVDAPSVRTGGRYTIRLDSIGLGNELLQVNRPKCFSGVALAHNYSRLGVAGKEAEQVGLKGHGAPQIRKGDEPEKVMCQFVVTE